MVDRTAKGSVGAQRPRMLPPRAKPGDRLEEMCRRGGTSVRTAGSRGWRGAEHMPSKHEVLVSKSPELLEKLGTMVTAYNPNSAGAANKRIPGHTGQPV